MFVYMKGPHAISLHQDKNLCGRDGRTICGPRRKVHVSS